MAGIEPHPVHIKGVSNPVIVNEVGIGFADARTNGVEALMHFPGLAHHHIRRQVRIEGIGQAVARDGGIGAEIGHVHPGVNPRIRAAAAGHMNPVPPHRFPRRLQGPGHSDQILLHLPAMVGGSQVCQT